MDTLRWKKTNLEEVYYQGVTYRVTPKNALLLEKGDKFLIKLRNPFGILYDYEIGEVIRTELYNHRESIKISFQTKTRKDINIYGNGMIIDCLDKILKIDLSDKNFWRNIKCMKSI